MKIEFEANIEECQNTIRNAEQRKMDDLLLALSNNNLNQIKEYLTEY
jgi:hypothetical protein